MCGVGVWLLGRGASPVADPGCTLGCYSRSGRRVRRDESAWMVCRSCKHTSKGSMDPLCQETIRAHVLAGQFITLYEVCWNRQDACVYMAEWEPLGIGPESPSIWPNREPPRLKNKRGQALLESP